MKSLLTEISVFALIVCLAICFDVSTTYAQQADNVPDQKMDTLSIFNGRIRVTMIAGTFNAIPAEQLIKKYKASFGMENVISACGFTIGKGDTLRFYQTSIEMPTIDDGGLSEWKMIERFTDKIPNSQWIESGWNSMGKGYLYFVKLLLRKKPEQLLKFNFFYIDNKLAFSVLQYPAFESYFTTHRDFAIVTTEEHPARFVKKQ